VAPHAIASNLYWSTSVPEAHTASADAASNPPPAALWPFAVRKALIGMVHVHALPGTPRARMEPEVIARQAAADARLLASCGFDGVIIENMHDAPYIMGQQDPVVTAAMTAAAIAVRQAAPDLPLGVQVLACGNKEAMAIALVSGAAFIRCENFVFSHVADEGLMPRAEAGELLRYRRAIGAQRVLVYADIDKKHASHALTADLSLEDEAHGAEFFGADGLIVTGNRTGAPTAVGDVRTVKEHCNLPVFVGSGVTPDTAESLWRHADGLIVGSWYKKGGLWSSPPDARRADKLVQAATVARKRLAAGR